MTQPPRRSLLAGLRASFLTGLVVVAPAAVTIWIIRAFVDFVDATVLPLLPQELLAEWTPEWLRGYHIPGLGVLAFLVFTLLMGWLARGYIGSGLIRWSEDVVARMPVIRTVYNAIKQIAETVFTQSQNSFRRACLIQYPRPGIWAVAFVSTETRGELATHLKGTHISVFMPTTPNPTSGFLLFVPESDVIYLDMSVEDAAKLIISAGLVTPDPNRPGKVQVN
jgi:uncharacterized membrane protein